MWYQSLSCMFFRFVTKHACDGRTERQTYGQTDRQNYDPQDRASIAASYGKNVPSPTLVALQRLSSSGFTAWVNSNEITSIMCWIHLRYTASGCAASFIFMQSESLFVFFPLYLFHFQLSYNQSRRVKTSGGARLTQSTGFKGSLQQKCEIQLISVV